MKYGLLFSIFFLLLLPGCEYDSPISEKQNIPIDSALLGLWDPISDEPDPRMMILKYSDTEYLIHFTGDDGMYFRGYPITIEDIPCVQVEFLGTTDGRLASNEEKRYQVAIYQFENNELTVKKLNTDIIDANLKDTALLKQEFSKNKNNEKLFTDFQKFRKLKVKN